MKLSGAWITSKSLQRVLACLSGAGHQALIVGGCVRNALLNAAVTDSDIATSATPQQVTDLVQANGMKAVPTGFDHGTVTVICDGVAHEVTTFRRDVDTDGRHATVAFSTDIADDAARRDFTMNALYAQADGTVLDPLGCGIADLRAGHLRFVGTPAERIREDYLRILRFFRFTAWYGAPDQGPDAEGLAACAQLADGLDNLARERVGQEMRKLLSAPNPSTAVGAMAQSGILNRILPGADPAVLFPLLHLEDTAPDPLRRLAALTGFDVTDALRLSKSETRHLDELRRAISDLSPPAAIGYRYGTQIGGDALLVRAALIGQTLQPGWRDLLNEGADATFPVKAQDLMPGFEGPRLGARLKELEAQWLAADFGLSKEDLLRG
ncbi:poly(A) polymerase [Thioclava sp. SK-1]|uniref:CCA tRNA nucleotidyltransferase n=1 Tax=Thioclava sp. SK-1 TaxID=1889770 RepID=UPI000824DC16|nr:CCA tRNA nucleotidyltransferase [Thioclava sp. SK-1]OCX61670.1 poly(A) polymerase [Thioclava sp. SK-1]